jgi:hypothetical protein
MNIPSDKRIVFQFVHNYGQLAWRGVTIISFLKSSRERNGYISSSGREAIDPLDSLFEDTDGMIS